MLVEYHTQICQQALADVFSPTALATIIAANIGQDRLRGQIGHHEYHFDHNAFAAGYDYIQKQRQILLAAMTTDDPATAHKAFGRLTHTAQDFYAHSNYVGLWIESFPEGQVPAPNEIEAENPKFLHHPKLKSGKIYLLDFVAFIPGFYNFAQKRVPKDSHTHMNLDHPERGPLFAYAFEAAKKRTRIEADLIQKEILTRWGEAAWQRFCA